MRRIFIALLFALCLSLSLVQGKALAEDCIKTVNAGAATVQTQLYEQGAALMDFSSGIITRDYKFNACGPSAFIRVNGNDWNKLASEGKVDGLRYQYPTKDGNAYSLTFKKMVGSTPQIIKGEDFFK